MITMHKVIDRRTLLTPERSFRREEGSYGYEPAVYDSPRIYESEVLAAFKRGETTVGYEVEVTVYGVGTTVECESRYQYLGDGDGVTYREATYRAEDGSWKCITISSDRSADSTNTATVDASPEVVAAYAAHLAAVAEAARVARAQHAAEKAEREARQERASIDRDKFVLVARGRKVPVGTVGRITWTGESEYGLRVGIATTTRTETATARSGRTYDKALDVAWSAASNCDVLMPMMPDSREEIACLYRFANVVSDHCYPVGSGEHIYTQTVTETFPAVWSAAYAAPWRLAVMAAYRPTELPRLDAETPRTLAEVCEAVEGMPDVAHRLSLMAAEYDPANAVEWKTATRVLVESCLGVVWTAPAKKARKARAPKAAKTDATV